MMQVDVIVIGAGAAGLMCALEAGKRGRRVLVLEHANKVGKKILMSGGGRCNFTNYHIHPDKYISHNPHFCKSALSRYTQWDFIELVKKHKIPFHEKTLGQLFCDNKAQAIVDMLLVECRQANVKINILTPVKEILKNQNGLYEISTQDQHYQCESLVVATGGLSIPTLGATAYGYKIAEQFGLKVWPTRAGLVPLTLHVEDKEKFSTLPGVSLEVTISAGKQTFAESLLFTHRGLSGPAVLQISSYWHAGNALEINLLPHYNFQDIFINAKQTHPDQQLKTFLSDHLPKRFVEVMLPADFLNKKIKSFSAEEIHLLSLSLHAWQIKPNGTEGYRTAEVTLGGVDCNEVSSKTMQATQHQGLYFIGEVLDISGWLGGYNFQWAWSSGWAAGQVV